MPKCRLFFTCTDGTPSFRPGVSVAVCRCEAHGVMLGTGPFAEDEMCGVGKIEKATEDSLTLIATAGALPRRVVLQAINDTANIYAGSGFEARDLVGEAFKTFAELLAEASSEKAAPAL